jgi:hypothetical protein
MPLEHGEMFLEELVGKEFLRRLFAKVFHRVIVQARYLSDSKKYYRGERNELIFSRKR